MSAYERFRRDIEDGEYNDEDPTKKSTEDFKRESRAALTGGAMSHEESRMLLLKYIDWLVRQLTHHNGKRV
jgi:hypothetical protein